jgi:hypothetical protein
VFLEVTFPDHLAALAEKSAHFTPAGFAREIRKLDRPVPVYAVHLKSTYRTQVIQELHALALKDLHVVEPGTTYSF